jgi:hypothetical protein
MRRSVVAFGLLGAGAGLAWGTNIIDFQNPADVAGNLRSPVILHEEEASGLKQKVLDKVPQPNSTDLASLRYAGAKAVSAAADIVLELPSPQCPQLPAYQYKLPGTERDSSLCLDTEHLVVNEDRVFFPVALNPADGRVIDLESTFDGVEKEECLDMTRRLQAYGRHVLKETGEIPTAKEARVEIIVVSGTPTTCDTAELPYTGPTRRPLP